MSEGKELHPSEVLERIKDVVAARITVTTLTIVAVILTANAATNKSLKYKSLLSGGAIITIGLSKLASDYERNKSETLGEIEKASKLGFQTVINSLVSLSSKLQISFDVKNWNPDNLIELPDLIKKLQRKHGRVIGGTGDGKSILAKAVSRIIEGDITVYDIEATKRDWEGLKVIGKGENWEAIADAMTDDLKLITTRVKEATSDDNDLGWDIFKGKTSIKIVEEYPDVKDYINGLRKQLTEGAKYDGLADEWCQRHARRGRKPGLLLFLISQYDTVGAWGFEGKGSLIDCFHGIRLGQFAIDQAKKVGGNRLAAWVEQDTERRIMVDNLPCLLPTRQAMILIGQQGINPQTNQLPEPETIQLNPVINSNANNKVAFDQLTDQQRMIFEYSQSRPNQKIVADNIKQSITHFKSGNYAPSDIRVLFKSLADLGYGATVGESDRLGFIYYSDLHQNSR